MTKEVPAFLRAEIGNDAADPTQEPQNRMLGRLAQMRLEFAEGQRGILRKINQRRARCFDRRLLLNGLATSALRRIFLQPMLIRQSLPRIHTQEGTVKVYQEKLPSLLAILN